MSIWASYFTLDDESELQAPYAVDYPPDVLPMPLAWLDVARTSWAPGWRRIVVMQEDGSTEAEIMLNPQQVRALAQALVSDAR